MKRFILLILLLFFCMQPAHAIKVGLIQQSDSVVFGVATDGKIVDAMTNKQLFPVSKLTSYQIRAKKDGFEVRTEDNTKFCINLPKVTLKSLNDDSYICINQKWYKGVIHLMNTDGKLVVINDVDLEDYVKGVTPAEMPSSWNMEALKAQAIAVRSYAMANLGKHASKGYDLVDTTADQVYNGVLAETVNTNRAVEETSGIVLIYNNKIISTMYSASAGGQTKSALQSFGNDVPYLQSVKSYDDEIPACGHGVGMTQHGAKNLANMGYNAYQILAYFYTGAHFARLNR